MSNYQINFEDLNKEIVPVEELRFEPISSRYRAVQIALTSLGYLLLACMALFLLLLDNPLWFIISETLILLAMSLNLIIVRKAWRFKGYALREHDISFRSGIIFPTVTTIPYQRVQQVSMTQNPISKYFDLYAVEVVNGAQALASLSIPGLSEEKANSVKNTVIDKLKQI